MFNPLHVKKQLSPKEERYVLDLRRARAGAKKAARSGNPRKRAEAEAALEKIPGMIRGVYTANLRRS